MVTTVGTEHSGAPIGPPRPYADVRVVDLSQGFAGPYAATLLADQGADVVKVEPPSGDWSRNIGTRHEGNTAFGITSNIAKRSIRVDARTAGGRDVIERLVAGADVVLQNYLPTAACRLGLDFESLRAVNHRLVYVSITGFGTEGPAVGRPATDMILQGWSGLARLGPDAEGRPRPLGFTVVDVAAGIYAAQRIGGALFEQARLGRGARIEISLLQAALALQGAALLDRALARYSGASSDGATRLAVPYGVYAAADADMMLSCINDRMWAGIREVLELDDILGDQGFETVEERLARGPEIDSAVTAILPKRTVAEWVESLSERGVLCGPVLTYDEVLSDPTITASRAFRQLRRRSGSVPFARFPGATLAGKPEVYSPDAGEHTEEVLHEIGFSDQRVRELLAAGDVYGVLTDARSEDR